MDRGTCFRISALRLLSIIQKEIWNYMIWRAHFFSIFGAQKIANYKLDALTNT